MDDRNDGSWWGDIQQTENGREQEEIDYIDINADRRKKYIITAAAIGIAIILLCGGLTAYSVLSGSKTKETPKREQTAQNKEKKDNSGKKKTKKDSKSSVTVMITADDADKAAEATISISESGKDGKSFLNDVPVALNDTVKVCTLPKGKYKLTVTTIPDGFDKPSKSSSFTVKGDGEKVPMFVFLSKHSEDPEEKTETAKDADSTTGDQQSSSDHAQSQGDAKNAEQHGNQSASSGTTGGNTSSGSSSSVLSTSSPTKTMTIHHPAETIRIAICDTCGADITDDIEGHKKSTGHPWYHYDAKVIKDAWDETINVN